jgi:hypothetical protein
MRDQVAVYSPTQHRGTEDTEGTEKSKKWKKVFSQRWDGDATFTVRDNVGIPKHPLSFASSFSFLCVLCVLCASVLG